MSPNARSQPRQGLRPAEANGPIPGPQRVLKSNQSRDGGRQAWLECKKLALTSYNNLCFPKFFQFPLGQEELSSGAWEADQRETE